MVDKSLGVPLTFWKFESDSLQPCLEKTRQQAGKSRKVTLLRHRLPLAFLTWQLQAASVKQPRWATLRVLQFHDRGPCSRRTPGDLELLERASKLSSRKLYPQLMATAKLDHYLKSKHNDNALFRCPIGSFGKLPSENGWSSCCEQPQRPEFRSHATLLLCLKSGRSQNQEEH